MYTFGFSHTSHIKRKRSHHNFLHMKAGVAGIYPGIVVFFLPQFLLIIIVGAENRRRIFALDFVLPFYEICAYAHGSELSLSLFLALPTSVLSGILNRVHNCTEEDIFHPILNEVA